MLTLSYESFRKARNYIYTNSNDINRAWFRYNFEDGDPCAFMDVLAAYQYENGGFGGLCYEFNYQGPCLKCTEIAIRYIFDLKETLTAEHPVIQNMMKYILDRYHPGIGNWGDVAEPEVNEGVHTHWVRYRGLDLTPFKTMNGLNITMLTKKRVLRRLSHLFPNSCRKNCIWILSNIRRSIFCDIGIYIRRITTRIFSRKDALIILSIFNSLCLV